MTSGEARIIAFTASSQLHLPTLRFAFLGHLIFFHFHLLTSLLCACNVSICLHFYISCLHFLTLHSSLFTHTHRWLCYFDEELAIHIQLTIQLSLCCNSVSLRIIRNHPPWPPTVKHPSPPANLSTPLLHQLTAPILKSVPPRPLLSPPPFSLAPTAKTTTRTSCFARMRTVTLPTASRRAARSPAALWICKFNLSITARGSIESNRSSKHGNDPGTNENQDVVTSRERLSTIGHDCEVVYSHLKEQLLANSNRITKLRENCEKEWEAHYKCLEKHNQEYYACRKPERTLNECVFSKLVRERQSYCPAREDVGRKLQLRTLIH